MRLNSRRSLDSLTEKQKIGKQQQTKRNKKKQSICRKGRTGKKDALHVCT